MCHHATSDTNATMYRYTNVCCPLCCRSCWLSILSWKQSVSWLASLTSQEPANKLNVEHMGIKGMTRVSQARIRSIAEKLLDHLSDRTCNFIDCACQRWSSQSVIYTQVTSSIYHRYNRQKLFVGFIFSYCRTLISMSSIYNIIGQSMK